MTADDASDPLRVVGQLAAALTQGYGVSNLVVTGSTALGVWAAPRQSRDLDLCAEVPAASVPRLLARFDGIAAGPPEDPGALRLRYLDWDVDVFVTGDDPYYRECAGRAVMVATPSGPVPVVTAEDLLVHKLIKLRSDRRRLLQDLADIRALSDARGSNLDWSYLERWLPRSEADLLRAVRSMDDDAVMRRLLGGAP
jgi:hypothetical protein